MLIPIRAIGLILALGAFGAQAQTIIPVGVTVSSEKAYLSRQGANMINGSGLNGLQLTNNPAGTMWMSEIGEPQTATFDLGANYNLTGMQVWNYNEQYATANGASNVVVAVASAVSGPFTVVGTYTFNQASGLSTYVGDNYSLSATNVRAVQLTINSSWAGTTDVNALGKVQFSGVPNGVAPAVIPVVGVTVSSENAGLSRQGANMINGAGLYGLQLTNIPDGTMWESQAGEPQTATFDLGANYNLTGMQVWNYNEHWGSAVLGANSVVVDVSSAVGGSFTTAGTYTFNEATGLSTYTGDNYSLSATNVRVVRFTINSSFAGTTDVTGLGKVQFYGALNVTVAPIVSIQPAIATRYFGAACTFTALVAGYPAPLLQWEHAGTNIVGATNPTLVLNNLQLADAGSYVVYATNAYGFTNSSPATLTVLPAALSATSAYVKTMLANNPIGYWRFNDGGGTNGYDYAGGNDADDVMYLINGNANPLTPLVGPATLQAGPQPPAFLGFEATNTAPFLDGYSQGFATTAFMLNTMSNYTVMGWFNINPLMYPLPTDPWHHPSGDTSLFGAFEVCMLGFSGGNLLFWNPGLANAIVESDPTKFTPGVWHFVAVASDTVAGTTTMYLDGVVVGTSSACSGASSFGIPFSIGKNTMSLPGGGTDTAFFPGSIDEVAVFDHPLSATQIQGIYFTAAPVILQAARSGASLQLTWSQGTLQQANAVTGPWTVVGGASSPWLVTPVGNQFYRVQVAP